MKRSPNDVVGWARLTRTGKGWARWFDGSVVFPRKPAFAKDDGSWHRVRLVIVPPKKKRKVK